MKLTDAAAAAADIKLRRIFQVSFQLGAQYLLELLEVESGSEGHAVEVVLDRFDEVGNGSLRGLELELHQENGILDDLNAVPELFRGTEGLCLGLNDGVPAREHVGIEAVPDVLYCLASLFSVVISMLS